jgi:hypothetical protein
VCAIGPKNGIEIEWSLEVKGGKKNNKKELKKGC